VKICIVGHIRKGDGAGEGIEGGNPGRIEAFRERVRKDI
jgi:hypothetical protein